MKKWIISFLLGLATACTAEQSKTENSLTIKQFLENFDFQCKHELRPPLSPETQTLYNYALYHDLHNMWTGNKGDELWQNMAVYYRIAAANGDYKANFRLQWLIETGRVIVKKTQTEVYHLNKELEKQLPATAYYKLYKHLENGYGVKTKDPDDRFVFLRKAADMGSRDAQYELAESLKWSNDPETLPIRLKIIEKLQLCAAAQGSGEAAEWQGIRFLFSKEYEKAVKVFHLGVKNGNEQSALRLYDGYRTRNKESNDYLALPNDPERAIRYKMISDYLYDYDFLQPKVPDLDQIVPLPPAKLPAWDGKIAFQRWYEGASPPKPSDELMQKLADKEGLDVKTGLPK